jgi:hypothetical protein
MIEVRASEVFYHAPNPFSFVIFQMQSCFCLGPALDYHHSASTSCIAKITDVYQHDGLFFEIASQ